jgi:hypothetical protein
MSPSFVIAALNEEEEDEHHLKPIIQKNLQDALGGKTA